MEKIKILLTFSLLLIVSALLSQNYKHKSNWYFSLNTGIGLSFSGSTPTIVTTGTMATTKACAVSSNKFGALQFYTEGVNVWDRNHGLMPTPPKVIYGQTLSSLNTNMQGANTLCDPYNENQYYVLSIAGGGPNVDSLFSFKVNMNLPGNGSSIAPLGDVVPNSKQFIAKNRLDYFTAVRHINNKDWWLVTINKTTNNVEVFLLSVGGISVSPSYVGKGGFAQTLGGGSGMGSLRVSPNNNKLIVAGYNSTSVNTVLFDFNRSTGAISNPVNLKDPTLQSTNLGVEFSPNSERLYLGQMWKTGNFFDHSGIKQYDLSVAPNQIVSSGVRVDSVTHYGFMPLQLGPDQKIYYSGDVSGLNGHIGCINSPNSLGVACNPNKNQITVPFWFNQYMDLITFPQFFEPISGANFTNSNPLCVNTPVSFSLTTPEFDCTNWNFGDPASASSNTSAVMYPTHTFTAAGTYTVKLVANQGCHCEADTIKKVITINNLPSLNISLGQSVMCIGETRTITASGATSYSWSNSSTNNPIVVSPNTSTSYTVTGTDGNGCSNNAIANILVSPCTGLTEEGEQAAVLRLYPNPASDLINISSIHEINSISIYSIEGKLIETIKLNSNSHQLNVNDYNKGLYFLVTEINNVKTTQKFVIN